MNSGPIGSGPAACFSPCCWQPRQCLPEAVVNPLPAVRAQPHRPRQLRGLRCAPRISIRSRRRPPALQDQRTKGLPEPEGFRRARTALPGQQRTRQGGTVHPWPPGRRADRAGQVQRADRCRGVCDEQHHREVSGQKGRHHRPRRSLRYELSAEGTPAMWEPTTAAPTWG